MGASSKKKGQQRKAAAKKALSAAAEGSSSDVGGSGGGSGGINAKTLAKIRSGDNKATKKLLSGLGFPSGVATVVIEGSGALSVVLEFLNRCEDETFEGIMNSVGGDLKSPSTWMNILSTGSLKEPSCKLQIAENIGPLVRCMINDTDRLLFKSNKHWRHGIVPFVNLVANITLQRGIDLQAMENVQIVDALLQHEGLLKSIIQWGFWDVYRPDIVKELRSEGIVCTGTVETSGVLIELLVNGMEGESRIRLLKSIGTTPVTNKEYDSTCMTSCAAGLVRRLKTANQRKGILEMVRCLIRDADCVDKGVIIELIDLGTNYIADYESAINVAVISYPMILEDSNMKNSHPNDTRAAFAIRTGLIEMCLGFIERFNEHECFGNDEVPMYTALTCFFHGINSISLHRKSAKAIRSKRNSIEEKLVSLEKNERISSNPKCKGLLDMIRSTLSINGSYCYRCNKSLSRTEVKECNGCHRMSYCSRSCQREDWLKGHKMTCCMGNGRHMGQFQGRYWPMAVPDDVRAATKMEELEVNITAIQLKLFLDNAETVLKQASLLDIPLSDCVVHFDLSVCPTKVETVKYSNERFYGSSSEALNDFEISRSKDNITCLYTSFFYNNGDLCPSGRDPNVTMQRLFPLELLVNSLTNIE